jgi:hypothetical protein
MTFSSIIILAATRFLWSVENERCWTAEEYRPSAQLPYPAENDDPGSLHLCISGCVMEICCGEATLVLAETAVLPYETEDGVHRCHRSREPKRAKWER